MSGRRPAPGHRRAARWPGWQIAGVYWDVESGGLDLEDRSQGESWRRFAAAGIPRDGGLAGLLAEAKPPYPGSPPSSPKTSNAPPGDTFNALKIEKELSRDGIPLFGADEPATIEGINSPRSSPEPGSCGNGASGTGVA